jgi:hypothetical protein
MLRLEYRSDEVAIGRDFYEKCLPLSTRFDRAVGVFASSVFAVCPALLAWLVATGGLQVRIARRGPASGNFIYHEKLGLFGDGEDNWLAFSGSANESLSGLEGNFESVDVFRSWVPAERKRVDQKKSSFDRLWANETEGVEVLSFPEGQEVRARPVVRRGPCCRCELD